MGTLYSTGLRRTECARLMLQDVGAERSVVFVRQGKGRKDRVVPIGQRALSDDAGPGHRYRRPGRAPLPAAGTAQGHRGVTRARLLL
ncbi:MAG: tyrosine-type recombinase/integrase [Gemmatimonadota bacterium]